MLISISENALWHYLPLKPKNPDVVRFEWERGLGEWSAVFSIAYDKYLKQLSQKSDRIDNWLTTHKKTSITVH